VDTRSKIIDPAGAARIAESGGAVVSGYFDPMTASHAARLAQLKSGGKPLLVLIASPEGAILPARARAELVAGLSVVDYVCDSADLPADIHLEDEHRLGLGKLIDHVHARQQAAKQG